MKIRLIKPCSEANDRVIIEGKIDLYANIEELYKKLKMLNNFSKMTFLPNLRTIWIAIDSKKILLFESGRITVSKCKTQKEGESLIKMIENMQGSKK